MKKRILIMIIAIVMVVGLIPGFAVAASAAESYSYPTSQPTTTWTGSGTEADPYVITTAQQLADFAWFVNNKNSSYYSKYYKLGNDIDLSGGTWEPIGYCDGSYAADKAGFRGTFDGNGKTVSGLNSVASSHKTMALFGFLEAGTIKNLTVSGEFASTSVYTGGICARMTYNDLTSVGSTIENCVNNVNISFTSTSSADVYAGGIVGSTGGRSTIKNCINNGTVTTKTDGSSTYVGGIVGLFSGGLNNLETCENTAAIRHTSTYWGKVGGICGYFNGNATTSFIKNCKNSGSVSGTKDVGGIVGRGTGIIEGCYNTAAITGTLEYVGGISGCTQNETITECYNTGNVTGLESVGGISGYSDTRSVIEICYNTGTITSTNTTANTKVMVGGIEGYTYGTSIKNCYNIGTVSGGSSTSWFVGGISGRLNESATVENSFNFGTVSNGASNYIKAIANISSGTITNCYFLSGTGTDTNANATEKTATEFSDGTVCNLLQAGNLELIWGQTIGTDAHPVFYNGSNSLGVDATGVTVAPTTATIGTGNTTSSVTLVATVSPINANVKTVTWTSSDDAVATVKDGVVTAVSKGTATITATSTDGGFTATCEVTVCDHVGSTHTEYTCANRQHTYTCTLCNLDVTVDCTIDTATGICTVCGTNVTAVNVTIGDSTTYYKELGTAIAYVNTLSGNEKVFVKLVADSTYDEIITLPARTIELDLNGNTAAVKNLVYLSGTDLTVKDTSESQAGELYIISVGGGVSTDVVYGAKLTLESGTIDGSVKHNIDGTFVMTGGTIQGTWAVYVRSATASVTITGGTAEGTDQKGLYYGDGFTGANVSLSGGTFVNGIRTPEGMTISDLLAENCVVQDANGVSYAESAGTMETLYVIYVHTHEWSYTASGDTITATCANTDGRCGDSEQSVVINAPYGGRGGLSFDNKVKAATISGTIEDVEIPEIVYTLKSTDEVAAPFAPGAYVASITIENATATCEFEIAKGTLTQLNFNYDTATTVTYDGTPKSVTVTPTDTLASYVGEVEVLYGGISTSPTDVSSYAISINVAESDYYNANTIALRSGRATVMLTISAKDIADLAYTDLAATYPVGATPDVTIQYNGMPLVKDTDYTIEYANNTTPGGTATMTITGMGNYTGTKTLDFNISEHSHSWYYELVGTDTIKATCTADDCPNTDGGSVTIAAPDSLVYTGSAIEAKVTNTLTTDDTVTVVYTAASGSALTNNEPVNVGTYTASITMGEGENAVTASVTYTITEKSIEGATVGTFDTMTYTGAAQSPNAVVTIDGLTVTGTWSDVTNVGEKATFTANGNFTGTVEADPGMAKAAPKVTAPTAISNLTYNGEAQTLVTAGSVTGGEMQYSLAENGTYGSDIPTGTNAGTYTVWYKVVGDSNHNDTAAQSITVTIAKATPTITVKSPVTSVLPGNTILLTVTASTDEVSEFTINAGNLYTVNGMKIKVSEDAVIGQDKITVTVASTATDNYNAGSATITLDVGMADFSGEIAELKEKLAALEGKYHPTADEINEIKSAIKALENGTVTDSELATKVSEINAEIEALADVYATKVELNVAVADLTALINGKADASALTDAVSKINSILGTIPDGTDIGTELAALDRAIEKLTTDVGTNTSGISDNASAISALTGTVNALKTSLEAKDSELAADIAELVNELGKLEDRVAANEADIAELKSKLETATKDLNDAITSGDKTLSDEIDALEKALADAKAALEKADSDNKAELVSKIETADAALEDAIKAVQKNLDDAKAELDKAIADGDTALDGKISNLNAALESAKAALEATDAANKIELEGKITDAQTSLQAAIDNVQTNLDNAKAELDKAIADLDAAMKQGDADLSAEIANLNTALTNAKAALEKADADNKAELVSKIETADATLDAAIKAVQKNLDDAKAELDTAIKNGDTALDSKIANLNAALESAKAALEATDAANKTELEGKITSAQTSLQAAIDKVAKDLANVEKELADAIASGGAAFDEKITALSNSLDAAKAALEAADASNKADLEAQIASAKSSLRSSINKVQNNLDDAVSALEQAIADGDSSLGDRVSALNTALENAISAYQAADGALKTELTTKIDEADAKLDAAIKAVQKNLDDAKAALEKALADGDKANADALAQAISDLNAAIEAAETAAATADGTLKSELTTKIDNADATLQAAIDALSTELDATNEKVGQLETFIIIVCVISGVAFCGCGTLAVWIFIDKKKKI